ncbi:MAG: acyltransferase [Thiocapsa sp.]|uniref:acyltransferase family protein n=1 Tax=Thiocapsa sp. TaxID=2024551 RepID=UPI001BD114E9|nr:acyltransferase family protein [Thiocapsa sp.]QVL49813.1 MAG: acyltransferase [Thiocapsa sp.]
MFTSSDRPDFRPDLQGLPAIAILLVVLAHANVPFAQGGFIGVDVFFVLSGYLISGLLIRELRQTGCIRFLRFYARRLKRLLPALAAMLVVGTAAALWLLSDLEARAQLASAPFAAAWSSNLYFAFLGVDYFNELAARDLFLHTWSLGVEEQFYIIWPPILFGLFLIARGDTRFAHRHGVWWWGLGLLLVASLALALIWTSTTPGFAFYLMPSRIWQFALGAVVFLALSETSPLNAPRVADHPRIRSLLPSGIIARAALGCGLAMIAGSALFLHPQLGYPGFWALIPSLGTALVIAAGHALAGGQVGPLAHPVLVWLGDRSYSWYLWHWPVLMLGFSLGFEGQPIPTLGLVLLSLLAAILSYRLVEYPIWKGRFSHAEPRRVLLISLLIMAALIAVLFHLWRGLAPKADDMPGANMTEWQTDLPVIYRMPCDAWYHHADVEPCIFGPDDAPRTVVLVGDSILAQWFSMVPALFPAPAWRIVVLTKSACAMVDEDYFYPRIGQVYTVCNEWRDAVLAEIERIRPEVVITGSAATYDFTETQWIEGSARVFSRLSNAAENVVVVPGTPSLPFDGPGCVARNLSSDGKIGRTACQATDRRRLVERSTRDLSQAVERFGNVHLLDLSEIVCPAGICNAVTEDGLLVFRDSQHLTDRFVRAMIPIVRDKLDAAVRTGGSLDEVSE